MKLGVFDSGIGGEAIAAALANSFPDATIKTVNDTANLPYGNKSTDQIRTLTNAAIQPLLGMDVIVIACNSATTAAIDWLRATYPAQKFIGIEPMLKPAAQVTKTNTVAVCATPATLASTRYLELKATYLPNTKVIEPDCSSWAAMIEDNTVNQQQIESTITACLKSGADVIVLGCTHYHWIKEDIEAISAGRAVVMEPSTAIASQVRNILQS